MRAFHLIRRADDYTTAFMRVSKMMPEKLPSVYAYIEGERPLRSQAGREDARRCRARGVGI
ncbi:hypothetical protein [Tardisphaera saccharovorans]